MLDVITALEWVHAHAQPPATVLMSLGGPAAQVRLTVISSEKESVFLTFSIVQYVVAANTAPAGGGRYKH